MLAEPEPTRLTIAQTRAVRTLLLGKSMVETARTCEVSERTLRHWKQQPAFRAALDAGHAQPFEQTRTLLSVAGIDAVQALLDVCRNSEAREATRVAAAGKLLTLIFRHLSEPPAPPATVPAPGAPLLPDAELPALLAGPEFLIADLPNSDHEPVVPPAPEVETVTIPLPTSPPMTPTPSPAPRAADPPAPLPTPSPLHPSSSSILSLFGSAPPIASPAQPSMAAPLHPRATSAAGSPTDPPIPCLAGSPTPSHGTTAPSSRPHHIRQKAATPGRIRSR